MAAAKKVSDTPTRKDKKQLITTVSLLLFLAFIAFGLFQLFQLYSSKNNSYTVKLQDMTGMNYEQASYLVDTYPGLFVPGSTPQPLTADQLKDTKLIDIIKKLNNRNNDGLSFTYEYTYNNAFQEFPGFLPTRSSQSVTVIEHSVVLSSTSFKLFNKENGKVTSSFTETSDYDLNYMGGKYAIKLNNTVPSQKVYASRLLDPDVAMLVEIIYGKDLKELGSVTLNGKSYVGFEAPASVIHGDNEETSEFYYTFYIDPASYSIELQTLTKGKIGEKNGIVVMTQKTLSKKYLTPTELSIALKPTELQNVPVKEFSFDNSIPLEPTLSSYSKNDIYYIDFSNMFLGHLVDYDQNPRQLTIAEKAQNTIEFNPSYISDTAPQEIDRFAMWLAYYQGTITSPTLGYEMYKNDPTKKQNNEGYSLISQHDVSLNYNGKFIKGVYRKSAMQLSMEDSSTKYFDCSITFKAENGNYYVVRQTFNPSTDGTNFTSILDKSEFTLLKLTPEKAKEFDKKKFTDF